MMKKSLFFIAPFFLLPVASFACAVCFGDGNSNLSRGFFWGVVVLGSLPFLLMGGFVSYLVYHTRKRKSQIHGS